VFVCSEDVCVSKFCKSVWIVDHGSPSFFHCAVDGLRFANAHAADTQA